MDAERAHHVQPGIDHVEKIVFGIEAGVEGAETGRVIEYRTADQGQRAVPLDLVAREGGHRGIDREEVFAVVGDLYPARSGLLIRERRGADGAQYPGNADVVGRDTADIRASMGVGDIKLRRSGRAEFTA